MVEVITYPVHAKGVPHSRVFRCKVNEEPLYKGGWPVWEYGKHYDDGDRSKSMTRFLAVAKSIAKQMNLPLLAPLDHLTKVAIEHLRNLPQTDEVKELLVELTLLQRPRPITVAPMMKGRV